MTPSPTLRTSPLTERISSTTQLMTLFKTFTKKKSNAKKMGINLYHPRASHFHPHWKSPLLYSHYKLPSERFKTSDWSNHQCLTPASCSAKYKQKGRQETLAAILTCSSLRSTHAPFITITSRNNSYRYTLGTIIHVWDSITSAWVFNIITHGYVIEFSALPPMGCIWHTPAFPILQEEIHTPGKRS